MTAQILAFVLRIPWAIAAIYAGWHEMHILAFTLVPLGFLLYMIGNSRELLVVLQRRSLGYLVWVIAMQSAGIFVLYFFGVGLQAGIH